MDHESIRKINLVEHLSESHPHITELSEREIHAWDEHQIRAYYTGARESQTRDTSVQANYRKCHGTCAAKALSPTCSELCPNPPRYLEL